MTVWKVIMFSDLIIIQELIYYKVNVPQLNTKICVKVYSEYIYVYIQWFMYILYHFI